MNLNHYLIESSYFLITTLFPFLSWCFWMQRSHCLPLNILLLASFTFYSALYWSTKRNHPFVLASFEIECDPCITVLRYYPLILWRNNCSFEILEVTVWSWFSTINRSCGSLGCRQWDAVSSGLIWLNVNRGISIFSLSQWSNHVWSLSLFYVPN